MARRVVKFVFLFVFVYSRQRDAAEAFMAGSAVECSCSGIVGYYYHVRLLTEISRLFSGSTSFDDWPFFCARSTKSCTKSNYLTWKKHQPRE